MYASGSRDLLIRARTLRMLDALEVAGATPIPSRNFHAFAYFVNVLSPLWDVDPLEGSVLKDERGPFFPELQRAIEYLINRGAIGVSDLQAHKRRISIKIHLDYDIAEPILAAIGFLPDESEITDFLQKLGFAFVEIVPDQRDDAAIVDASWSDPAVDDGRVIDFGELVRSTRNNPAWNVAQRLQSYAPEGITLNRSEKLLMYMRLMKQRAHG